MSYHTISRPCTVIVARYMQSTTPMFECQVKSRRNLNGMEGQGPLTEATHSLTTYTFIHRYRIPSSNSKDTHGNSRS